LNFGFWILDQINSSFHAALDHAAVLADPGDDQAVTENAKPMTLGDGVAQLQKLVALEFEQLTTLLAVQMVVLRIAVVVLVYGSAIELEFAEQSGIHELLQRPIDRWPTDSSQGVLGRHLLDQRIRVEMFVMAKHEVDDLPALLGITHRLALQILVKPLLRGQSDFDFSERIIFRHAADGKTGVNCALIETEIAIFPKKIASRREFSINKEF
jgi:hypothetical protein